MTRQTFLRGFLAFFIILLMMPLGHAFVVLMEHHLTGFALKCGAFFVGAAGVAIALAGNRLPGEAMQSICGAFGAILFWGGWVEFIYMSYGQSLHVPPLMDGEVVLTKPEYLLMPTAIPFAFLALLIYTFCAHTHWGVVLQFRRWLGIPSPKGAITGYHSVNAFIDLILLIWFAYLVLLIEFDPAIFGDRHPVTMIFATVCLILGLILFVRSLSAQTWASAVRQAIVTVCVLWTYIEVLIRLKFFTEIWIYPERYTVEMLLLVGGFIVALYVISYLGHKKK